MYLFCGACESVLILPSTTILNCYCLLVIFGALLKHETRNAKQQNNEITKQRNRDIFFHFIFLCAVVRLFGSPVSNARATSCQLVPRLVLISGPEMRLGTGLARSLDGRLMDEG